MTILNPDQVTGGTVSLDRTHPGHLQGKTDSSRQSGAQELSFGDLVVSALNGTNSLINESSALTEQYIINPDSVDVHDVTIAMGKANLAISMTKSVVDNAIKAYREIINIR